MEEPRVEGTRQRMGKRARGGGADFWLIVGAASASPPLESLDRGRCYQIYSELSIKMDGFFGIGGIVWPGAGACGGAGGSKGSAAVPGLMRLKNRGCTNGRCINGDKPR